MRPDISQQKPTHLYHYDSPDDVTLNEYVTRFIENKQAVQFKEFECTRIETNVYEYALRGELDHDNHIREAALVVFTMCDAAQLRAHTNTDHTTTRHKIVFVVDFNNLANAHEMYRQIVYADNMISTFAYYKYSFLSEHYNACLYRIIHNIMLARCGHCNMREASVQDIVEGYILQHKSFARGRPEDLIRTIEVPALYRKFEHGDIVDAAHDGSSYAAGKSGWNLGIQNMGKLQPMNPNVVHDSLRDSSECTVRVFSPDLFNYLSVYFRRSPDFRDIRYTKKTIKYNDKVVMRIRPRFPLIGAATAVMYSQYDFEHYYETNQYKLCLYNERPGEFYRSYDVDGVWVRNVGHSIRDLVDDETQDHTTSDTTNQFDID